MEYVKNESPEMKQSALFDVMKFVYWMSTFFVAYVKCRRTLYVASFNEYVPTVFHFFISMA